MVEGVEGTPPPRMLESTSGMLTTIVGGLKNGGNRSENGSASSDIRETVAYGGAGAVDELESKRARASEGCGIYPAVSSGDPLLPLHVPLAFGRRAGFF